MLSTGAILLWIFVIAFAVTWALDLRVRTYVKTPYYMMRRYDPPWQQTPERPVRIVGNPA